MNRKFVLLVLFIIFSCGVFTQQKDDKGVYLSAEKMPAIKGGKAAIAKKDNYPRIAREMGIKGVVYVGFIVDPEGKVIEPTILKSVAKPLDEEALRVITKEVKFTPGYYQGKAVPVRMVLPIRFRI